MQGISTHKTGILTKKSRIETLSAGKSVRCPRYLSEQAIAFRSRSLFQSNYPISWVNALYEQICINSKIVSILVLVVCGVDEHSNEAF